MNIAIFEDDKNQLALLTNIIEDYLDNNLKNIFDVALATDNKDQMIRFLSKQAEPCLFFIDLVQDSTKENIGFSLLDSIYQKNTNNFAVIVTGHQNRIAYKAKYKWLADIIIMKDSPEFTDEIYKTLENVYHKNELRKKPNLIVKASYFEIINIPYDNISALEVEGKYVTIYYSSGNNGLQLKARVRGNLHTYEEKLKSDKRFIRCNRSNIINIEKVQKVNTKHKKLSLDGYICYYGENYGAIIRNALDNLV